MFDTLAPRSSESSTRTIVPLLVSLVKPNGKRGMSRWVCVDCWI
jgi:hypothetical protein